MKKKIILIIALMMCLTFTLGIAAVNAEEAQNLPVATEETGQTEETDGKTENGSTGENSSENEGENTNGE